MGRVRRDAYSRSATLPRPFTIRPHSFVQCTRYAYLEPEDVRDATAKFLIEWRSRQVTPTPPDLITTHLPPCSASPPVITPDIPIPTPTPSTSTTRRASSHSTNLAHPRLCVARIPTLVRLSSAQRRRRYGSSVRHRQHLVRNAHHIQAHP